MCLNDCLECNFFKNSKLAETVLKTKCNPPASCQNCPVLKSNSYYADRIDELILENYYLKEQILETVAIKSELEYQITIKDAIIKDKNYDITMLKTMIGELQNANNK